MLPFRCRYPPQATRQSICGSWLQWLSTMAMFVNGTGRRESNTIPRRPMIDVERCLRRSLTWARGVAGYRRPSGTLPPRSARCAGARVPSHEVAGGTIREVRVPSALVGGRCAVALQHLGDDQPMIRMSAFSCIPAFRFMCAAVCRNWCGCTCANPAARVRSTSRLLSAGGSI